MTRYSRALATKSKRSLFLRGLFLQSLWTYEKMQGLGLVFAMGGKKGAGCFSVEPHMSGFVFGVLARLEADQEAPGMVSALKASLGSALSAIGDPLFSGALRSLSGAVGGGIFLGLGAAGVDPGISAAAGVFAAVALFNIPSVWVRWAGIGAGYEAGRNIAVVLARYPWQRSLMLLRKAGVVAALLLAAGVQLFAPEEIERRLVAAAVLGLPFSGIRISGIELYAAVTTGAIGAALLSI